MMPLEATLVSVVCAVALNHDKALDPCEHMQYMPLIDVLVVASGFAASKGHPDVTGM